MNSAIALSGVSTNLGSSQPVSPYRTRVGTSGWRDQRRLWQCSRQTHMRL